MTRQAKVGLGRYLPWAVVKDGKVIGRRRTRAKARRLAWRTPGNTAVKRFEDVVLPAVLHAGRAADAGEG